MGNRRVISGVPAALAPVVALSGCEPDPVRSTVDRLADPVVVVGAGAEPLAGVPADRVVASRRGATAGRRFPGRATSA